LDATRQLVLLDSATKHGHVAIAQYQIELNRPDSALASLHAALASGDDSTFVATFALAKGNALYQAAAGGSQSNADLAAALRMLAFADSVQTSEQARFLTGVAALAVAQTALKESMKLTDKGESCKRVRVAADVIPLARTGLHAGEASFAETAKQSLDLLDQIDPYAQQQLKVLCVDTDRPPSRN
jgi:hypothetical protein